MKEFCTANFPYQLHRDQPIIIFNRESHCAASLESELHYTRVQCSDYGIIKSNDFKRFTDPYYLKRGLLKHRCSMLHLLYVDRFCIFFRIINAPRLMLCKEILSHFFLFRILSISTGLRRLLGILTNFTE